MLDTSELFKANFRNMESLKKINILNDLSKVNFGFKENTNRINESLKKINILNDLSKVNFGIMESFKKMNILNDLSKVNFVFKENTNRINESLKRIYGYNDLFKVNFGIKETTNGINEAFKKINILNDLSKVNFGFKETLTNFLTQNYAKTTKPEVGIFQQDVISTELALQIPKQEENKRQIKFEYGHILDLSCNIKQCLENIKPGLVRRYEGALQSFLGTNPDKARHVLTSLRKLSHDLLYEIATYKEVKIWIDSKPDLHKFNLLNNKNESFIYDKEGKFLRKTKLAWLFKKEKRGFLSHFSKSKNQMIESTINLTNELHSDLDNISQKDLCSAMLSAKYTIDYICLYYQGSTNSQ